VTTCDLLLILDHLAAECGVRVRYSRFLAHCDRLGLRVAVIADAEPVGGTPRTAPWLTLRVPDEQPGWPLKRRPFVAFGRGTDLGALAAPHGLTGEQMATLDAWTVSKEWVRPAVAAMRSFVERIVPQKTIVATQSFLGFAATCLDLCEPAAAFHTDYGAFYAARIVGQTEGQSFTKLRQGITGRIVRRFLPRMNAAIVSSPRPILGYERVFSEIKAIYQFPGGVDTDRFSPARGRRRKGPLRVLVVGRLAQEKGTNLLMEAWPETRSFDWTFLGDGPERRRMSEAMPGASFHGVVSRREVGRQMALADVFVFLGVFDTFGISALEAMSCALPVIAASGSGIAALVEQGGAGIVIPPECGALVDALKRLASDAPLRFMMGERGRALAEMMTWERACGQFLRDYAGID
jgi:glycosyltransferase involved in cell wall biosynthesis